MSNKSILFAKLAGLQKNFSSIDFGGGRILGTHVEHLVEQYYILEAKLQKEIPELYSDLSSIAKPEPMGKGKNNVNIYYKSAITPIIQRIDSVVSG